MNSTNITATLKRYFGYTAFRPAQEELITAILSGQDVLGIMPTGAGKSICYQVPALMMGGITVVISPLISLMKDQVYSLNQAGIHAAYINSSLTENQIHKAFGNAQKGVYKIIYIAPERLDTPQFKEFIAAADISMVAVDEAHCVSQWGQDFRPGYLNIPAFIRLLHKRPVVCAFTATATNEVREDIAAMLELTNPKIMITGFDRQNLFFAVKHTRDKKKEMLRIVAERSGQSGIIYCATRKNVDESYELLKQRGVPAARYHAGMSSEDRTANQEDFIYDRKPVIVATNAFGMGIDKSNVRYVLHYNMPQSMENYYQEAGRAGRDGESAECILLYAPQDVVINQFLIENKESKKELTFQEEEEIRRRDRKRLNEMVRYCTTKDCLRGYMLCYFGEAFSEKCGHCGNCLTQYEQHDVTEIGRQIMNCVFQMRQSYGVNMIIGVLRGSKTSKILEAGFDSVKSYGALSGCSEPVLREVMDMLIREKLLEQTEDRYPVIRFGKACMRIKEEDFRIFIKSEVKQKEHAGKTKSGRIMLKAAGKSGLTEKEAALFEELRALRAEIARAEHVPPYIVFSDKTLADMCNKLPGTKEEMLTVSGVGQNKLERYGERFIAVIRKADAEKRGGISRV